MQDWQMENADENKQVQEVVFLEKQQKKDNTKLVFNNSPVLRSNFQKHLEVYIS